MNTSYFRYAGIVLLFLSVLFIMDKTQVAGVMFGQRCTDPVDYGGTGMNIVCGEDENFARTAGLVFFAVGSLLFSASFWKAKQVSAVVSAVYEMKKQCPCCGEIIEQEKKLCQFCGKDV